MARLLNALEAEGAIEQDQAGGVYRLGHALEELAGGSSQGRSLIAAAQPFLVDLSEQTEEASGLDILDDREVHFMDMVESGQDVQIRDWTGEGGPPTHFQVEIAILAHLGEAAVEAYIDGGLEAMTQATVVSAEELRERLVQVRSAGYAGCTKSLPRASTRSPLRYLGPTASSLRCVSMVRPIVSRIRTEAMTSACSSPKPPAS